MCRPFLQKSSHFDIKNEKARDKMSFAFLLPPGFRLLDRLALLAPKPAGHDEKHDENRYTRIAIIFSTCSINFKPC